MTRPQRSTESLRDVGGTLWRKRHNFGQVSGVRAYPLIGQAYQLNVLPIRNPMAEVLFEAEPLLPMAKS